MSLIYKINIVKKLSIFLLSLLFTSSCNLFTTRSPEEPSTGKSNFVTPTTAHDVISNFTNAIKEKNIDNYIACFTDSSHYAFSFIPSSDAKAQFPTLFDKWNLSMEKQYLIQVFSNMDKDVLPQIALEDKDPDNSSPESVLYVLKYSLIVNHNVKDKLKEFSGTLRFVIVKQSNGLWAVQEWTDVLDTTGQNTWSFLKAQFSN